MNTEQNARILNLLTIAADNAGEDQRDPVTILDRMEAVERLRLDERTVTMIEAWYAANDTWAGPDDVLAAVEGLKTEQTARRKAKPTSSVRQLMTY